VAFIYNEVYNMLAIKRGIFQFRAVIPTELRPTLKKREIWRSLGTSNKAEALKLEAKAAYEFDALLQRIRAIVTPKQPFKQITSLFVDANAGTVKAEGDLTSADMAELGKLVATITGAKTHLNSDDPVNLKEKLPDYINEKMISKAWASDKTKDCAVGYINTFFEFAGDKPVSKAVVADFKKDLLGQTMRGGLPMSVNTVNKYLTALSGYFKFLHRNEVIPQNYCDGMLIATTRSSNPSLDRKAFDLDDLKAIFSVTDVDSSDAMRWVPRLSLFTGCRIEELCQLHHSDIREINGIWCIDINDDLEKKVKTQSSKRIIPLHDTIRDGFIAYVQSLDKGSRLFPELTHKRDGYSQDLSKKFGRLLRKKAKISDPQKVFHSFRHSFATALKRALVSEDVAGVLMGHKNESMTYGRYGKDYPANTLKEAIDRIQFDI
jgi:integrase